MKTYLLSAFTPRMLNANCGTIEFEEINLAAAGRLLELGKDLNCLVNGIIHPAIASMVDCVVDTRLPLAAKQRINLLPGDRGIIMQYTGPRLPETELTPAEIERAFNDGYLTAMKFSVRANQSRVITLADLAQVKVNNRAKVRVS